MPKVFKAIVKDALTPTQRRIIEDEWWPDRTNGTDLEGSVLIVCDQILSVEPLSEGAVLELAADALDNRGRHVYAAELRKLAGETK